MTTTVSLDGMANVSTRGVTVPRRGVKTLPNALPRVRWHYSQPLTMNQRKDLAVTTCRQLVEMQAQRS